MGVISQFVAPKDSSDEREMQFVVVSMMSTWHSTIPRSRRHRHFTLRRRRRRFSDLG